MTELVMPIISEHFRKYSPSKRRRILDGLAERLSPLSKGAIGLMIDKNNAEAAFNVIRRFNERAREQFITRAALYVREHKAAYPRDFEPPFHYDPAHPDVENGKWGTMLREAFSAHL